VRVVIADDSLLVREGIASLLRSAGVDVVAQLDGAEELVDAVGRHEPDAAIIDVRMPPTFTDEGLRAAHATRSAHPGVGIVILSQHVEVGVAMQLLAEHAERLGYLLKDRVTDVDDFVGTLRRVVAGGSALDPQVISGLLSGERDSGPLGTLTGREMTVLELVAEGRSNQGIGERMSISPGGVSKHVASIFGKLGLAGSSEDDRRTLAVLTYLRAPR
jgi:DNA-binding NarL/FixJ family response regulator